MNFFKEITLQTIIEDIDELHYVCEKIKTALDELLKIFSARPTYDDFLQLLSQQTDFDINFDGPRYPADSLFLAVTKYEN